MFKIMELKTKFNLGQIVYTIIRNKVCKRFIVEIDINLIKQNGHSSIKIEYYISPSDNNNDGRDISVFYDWMLAATKIDLIDQLTDSKTM